jgi:hypothetical protein
MNEKDKDMLVPTFKYIGGDIWTLEELGDDGYDKTVLSIEMERHVEPFILDMGRSLTKVEVQKLVVLVSETYSGFAGEDLENS